MIQHVLIKSINLIQGITLVAVGSLATAITQVAVPQVCSMANALVVEGLYGLGPQSCHPSPVAVVSVAVVQVVIHQAEAGRRLQAVQQAVAGRRLQAVQQVAGRRLQAAQRVVGRRPVTRRVAR